MGWLPDGFETPQRLDLETGHHLRPIRGDDVDIDYPAVLVLLDEIDLEGLDEVIVEAWLCRAPKRLAEEFLATRG